jgi:hypothetical protein
VSVIGASACEKPTQPDSVSSADGERAERIHVRLVQVARAELEHLDQAGLIQHRVGIRRAHQRGHAAGHRRGHF